MVELVILLKVSITKPNTNPDPADERLRQEYVADPRIWKSYDQPSHS